MTKEKIEELKTLARPIKDWIKKNYHPHAQVIIDTTNVNVLEGVLGGRFEEEFSDQESTDNNMTATTMKCDECGNTEFGIYNDDVYPVLLHCLTCGEFKKIGNKGHLHITSYIWDEAIKKIEHVVQDLKQSANKGR